MAERYLRSNNNEEKMLRTWFCTRALALRWFDQVKEGEWEVEKKRKRHDSSSRSSARRPAEDRPAADEAVNARDR